MSELENQDQPAEAVAVPEEVAASPEAVVEEPLYEFKEATFTSGQPVVEVKPEPVVEEAPKPKAKAKPVETVATHVVGNGDADEVFLKQCVYKNQYARKSLTIHHLQRRLNDLGYPDAHADRDGWYGDLTKAAVEAWQKDNGFEPTGLLKADTFTAIFAGDPNVVVVLPE
jgi:peptidoglycan hydrolase-like protein with peptidoglycan-binding domain